MTGTQPDEASANPGAHSSGCRSSADSPSPRAKPGPATPSSTKAVALARPQATAAKTATSDARKPERSGAEGEVSRIALTVTPCFVAKPFARQAQRRVPTSAAAPARAPARARAGARRGLAASVPGPGRSAADRSRRRISQKFRFDQSHSPLARIVALRISPAIMCKWPGRVTSARGEFSAIG